MDIEFHYRAVVFANDRKNDCSFFCLNGLVRIRAPPVLDFDKFQNSEFGGKENGKSNRNRFGHN